MIAFTFRNMFFQIKTVFKVPKLYDTFPDTYKNESKLQFVTVYISYRYVVLLCCQH